MFGKGFDATKLKASLRLASSRFDVATHKKSALMKHNMREVALLLAEDPPKEEKARIRTERLIKDDYMIEAYEILQLECQLLVERVGLLKHSKGVCPPDLVTTVSDLIYAAPRCDDVTELQDIKKQLEAKFGKKFALDADNNTNNVISQRIVEKLSLAPPTAYMVQTYMSKICTLHEVEYEPTLNLTMEEAFEPVAAPIGYSVPMAQGTGIAIDKETKFESKNSSTAFVGALATTGTVASTGANSSTNPEFKEPPVVPAFAFASEGEISNLSNDMDEVEDSKPPATAPSAPEQPQQHQERSIGFDKEEEHIDVLTGFETVDAESKKQGSTTVDKHQDEVSEASAPPAPEQEESSESYMAVTGLSSATAKVSTAQSDDSPAAVSHEVEEESEAKSVPQDANDLVASGESKAHHDSASKLQFSEDNTDTANSITEEQRVRVVPEGLPTPANGQVDQLQLLRDRLAGLGGGGVPTQRAQEDNTLTATDEEIQIVDSVTKDLLSEEPAHDETAVKDCMERGFMVDQPATSEAEAPCETTNERELVMDTEHSRAADAEEHAATSSVASSEAEAAIWSHKDNKEQSVEVFVVPTSNIVETDANGSSHQEDDRALPAETRDTASASRDPAKDQEHITGAALAGGAVGFTVGGPIGGFLGAAGVAHLAANKKGKAADLARKCGKKVTKMTNKLVKEIEKAST